MPSEKSTVRMTARPKLCIELMVVSGRRRAIVCNSKNAGFPSDFDLPNAMDDFIQGSTDMTQKLPVGRPSKYEPEYAEQAAKLCALGATDADLADFFHVNIRTINRWRCEHEEFSQAVKEAKDVANARVERSLYQLAVGYSYDAEKIFLPTGAAEPVRVPYREHVPPNPTAMIFFLKNRDPGRWRDKQNVEHSVELSLADLVIASYQRPKLIEE
jgi:hypothetical protein